MKKRILITIILFCLVYRGWAQNAVLKIEGEVTTPLNLSVDDLLKITPLRVTAKDHDEKNHEFTGVSLHEVLKLAGVTLGGQLRGKNLAKYILVKASDGYEVVYALPEVDPEFTNDIVMLAFLVDGNPLPKGVGPFRLIAPSDKKHARWIREITTIKIVASKE